MVREAVKTISSAGLDESKIEFFRTADMHFRGQGYEINVPMPADLLKNHDTEGLRQAFHKRYQELYRRYMAANIPIEIVNLRLTAQGKVSPLRKKPLNRIAGKTVEDALKGNRKVFFPTSQSLLEVPVYNHYHLPPNGKIKGPAIVEQRESTVVIGPEDKLRVDPFLNLIIDVG